MRRRKLRSLAADLARAPSLQRAAAWLVSDMGPTKDTGRLAGRSGERLPLNAVCEPSFWDDGEWRGYGRALGIPQDEGWYHRKAWEWTQCAYGLERLNALGRNKFVLGVGTGHERVLYYMANRSALTVATDLYSGDFSDSPAQEADPAFLKDPARFAPFVYDQRRLLALPADGCHLPFQSGSFDVVYSLSSIEHFGGHERASEAMREMNRVLSPGGTACVATELVLEGGPHPAYFTLEHLNKYVVGPAGMSLVEPLADGRPSLGLLNDPVVLPEDYQKTPHIVLQEGPWKFTSVCLFMRKPTHVDRMANWLRRESM
jgi:SAM-dependent methyltransferase